MKFDELVQAITEKLVDEGLIIEGGFAGFKSLCIPKNVSDDQINDMRMAFFAGAQHLFSSIMAVMDSDREPTEKDMERMDIIHAELEKFRAEFELQVKPTQGSA